jgi:hypothetical protein
MTFRSLKNGLQAEGAPPGEIRHGGIEMIDVRRSSSAADAGVSLQSGAGALLDMADRIAGNS